VKNPENPDIHLEVQLGLRVVLVRVTSVVLGNGLEKVICIAVSSEGTLNTLSWSVDRHCVE